MNVYVNRDVIRSAWGGGAHFVNALHDYASMNSCVIVKNDSSQIDAIVIAGLDAENGNPSAEFLVNYAKNYAPAKKPKLVIRVNECDARKGTNHVDERVIKIASQCDLVVYVSNWMRDYFVNKGLTTRSTVVVNGVDRNVFVAESSKLITPKIRIVAHHWSNNYMKGFDYYELLDQFVKENNDFQFTYIGRDRGTFTSTNVIKPLYGKTLGNELRNHDVYVSASRFDPGPNHVIESIACGLPTYVFIDGGGAVEFAGVDHAYSSWEDLKSILLQKQYVNNVDNFGTWQTCISNFFNVVRNT